MQNLDSPLESILGINFQLAAVIKAQIGDFQRFSSSDKTLAFLGLSTSIYQSGKFISQSAVMEKRDEENPSRYNALATEQPREILFWHFCQLDSINPCVIRQERIDVY